jgi:peptide/nickel transport system substrate-binding protein
MFMVVAVTGLVLGSATSVGASTPAAAKPRSGGTLTLAKATEFNFGWDPVKFQGVGSNGEVPQAIAIFDVLFYEDPATLKLVPRIGTSLTSPDSGRTWTLKLRPNVKFSDGTPYDAEAVRFNWARYQDPANGAFPFPAATANAAQTMEVVDPVTLRVTLKSPDPNWNRRVAERLAWIASPTALKTLGAGFGTKPVGAGPFLLKDWVRSSSYTFVRNPTYWQKGRPYLDELDIKLIADEASLLNNAQAGTANVVVTFDPNTAGQAKQAGMKVISMAANGGGFAMMFNTAKAPFNDVRVRNAMDLAIDRKAFNDNRRDGAKDSLMSTLDAPGTAFYDPTVKVPKYDLTGAQKLIDQVVAEKGGPVRFTFSIFNTQYIQQDAQFLVAQLSKLKNVEITIEPLAPSELVRRYTTGDLQAFTQLSSARWNEPAIDLTNMFSSTNIMKYTNPTVTTALQQLVTATDQKTRQELVHTALTQVLKDSPLVWYTRQASNQIVDKKVQDFDVYFDQVPLVDQVWLGKSKT